MPEGVSGSGPLHKPAYGELVFLFVIARTSESCFRVARESDVTNDVLNLLYILLCSAFIALYFWNRKRALAL